MVGVQLHCYLPHQRVIITILLLLSSSLTGWPALKYTLNHLRAHTKWPIGSLLSVIKRKKLAGGEDTAPADTKLFVNLNLRRQLRGFEGGNRKQFVENNLYIFKNKRIIFLKKCSKCPHLHMSKVSWMEASLSQWLYYVVLLCSYPCLVRDLKFLEKQLGNVWVILGSFSISLYLCIYLSIRLHQKEIH